MTFSRLLLVAAFIASALLFAGRVLDIAQRGFEDFPIFYQAARHYLETGILYTRHVEHYYPASGIYKFPSLYAGFLLLLIQAGIGESAAAGFLLGLHVVIYLAAAALLIQLVLPMQKRMDYGLAMATIVLAIYPVRDTLVTLQLEMYVFAGLVAVLYLLRQKKYFSSGAVLGFLSCLKIYPAFFLVYGVVERRAAFFYGALAAVVVSLLLMLAAVGWQENAWFVQNALPVMLNEGAFVNHVNVGIEKLINHAFSSSQFIHWQTPIGVGSAALAKLWLWLACALVLFACYRRRYELHQPGAQLQALLVSLLVTLLLMTLKNPWSNYQLLLLIPLLLLLPMIGGEGGSWQLRVLYACSMLLLLLAPSNASLVFAWLYLHVEPAVVNVLAIINDRLFAWRGLATVLLYLLLLKLMFRSADEGRNR